MGPIDDTSCYLTLFLGSRLKDNYIEKPWFLLETPQKKLKDDFLHVQKILVKSESILKEPSILEEHPINSSAVQHVLISQ